MAHVNELKQGKRTIGRQFKSLPPEQPLEPAKHRQRDCSAWSSLQDQESRWLEGFLIWGPLKTGIVFTLLREDGAAPPWTSPASRTLPALKQHSAVRGHSPAGRLLPPLSQVSLFTPLTSGSSLKLWAQGPMLPPPRVLFADIWGWFYHHDFSVSLHITLSPVLCLLSIWSNVHICHSPCHCSLNRPSLVPHLSKLNAGPLLSPSLSKRFNI